MEKRSVRIALIVCAVLFLAACIFSVIVSQDHTGQWEHERSGQVILSEILPSNRTCPAPDGRLLDFVEVHNLSASSVDISGYMICDDLNSIGYTFPDGTVLPAYGYAVCWCDKESDSDDYASFGISKDGGDTIYLYNNANVLVDEKEVPPVLANTALVRVDDSTWETAVQATPGYPNTAEGYQQWLDTMGGDKTQVTVTEVMSANSSITAGAMTVPMDWVELTNTGKNTVTLEGAYLSNDPVDPLKWMIPTVTLAPQERIVIPCAGGGTGEEMATFALSKTGCTVVLTGRWGNVLSSVKCPELLTDHSWAMQPDGSYRTTDLPTPGFANDQTGYGAWMESIAAQSYTVSITEVQTSNRSTIVSKNGVLCDWVELTNNGTEAVVLDGVYLSDDPDQHGKWQIPSLTLEPGARAVILCAGNLAGEGEAPFGLSQSGGEVILTGPKGNLISQIAVPRLANDRSWALLEDGSWVETQLPSPGFANTEEGYTAYRESRRPTGALMISEIMSANDEYMIQPDARYYDWVELVNTSDQTINLADYCLSNDPENRTLFRLPKKNLAPGGRIVVICSGDSTAISNQPHAPFTISAEEEWLYLSDGKGNLCDCLRVYGIPDGGSMGRQSGSNAWYYFATPTPERKNGTGYSQISQEPVIATQGGVYQNVSSVTVELQGVGTLHYTLDGSKPTEKDPVYTGPFALTETAVVRVISCESGKLASSVVTQSYIINENHTLPVVSLTADPAALFGSSGIYDGNDPNSEIPCSIEFYEEKGSFSMDAGLELLGSTPSSLAKKSLQVNFRGRYGASALGYALFDEEQIQVMDALCIRSGSDYTQSIFRDELFSRLCLDMTDDVIAQRNRFCVLYINGDYWGIYSLKEKINELYYAQKENVSLSSVQVVEGNADYATELQQLASYCAKSDMTLQESYDHVAAQLDLENLIDWVILQGYSCNTGATGNIQFLRSPENGNLWELTFYDLDNAFYDHTPFESILSPAGTAQYLDIIRGLMKNETFRTAFLQRLSQVRADALSNEHVLGLIDFLSDLLAPEVQRERQRWNGHYESWEADVQRLRSFIVRYDHWAMIEENLRACIGLTDAEAAQYFGR